MFDCRATDVGAGRGGHEENSTCDEPSPSTSLPRWQRWERVGASVRARLQSNHPNAIRRHDKTNTLLEIMSRLPPSLPLHSLPISHIPNPLYPPPPYPPSPALGPVEMPRQGGIDPVRDSTIDMPRVGLPATPSSTKTLRALHNNRRVAGDASTIP